MNDLIKKSPMACTVLFSLSCDEYCRSYVIFYTNHRVCTTRVRAHLNFSVRLLLPVVLLRNDGARFDPRRELTCNISMSWTKMPNKDKISQEVKRSAFAPVPHCPFSLCRVCVFHVTLSPLPISFLPHAPNGALFTAYMTLILYALISDEENQ